MKVYIYVLKDPKSLEVRYVGLTRYPSRRLGNEINYPHTKHLRNWVESLKKRALLPEMEIVEESEEGVSCDAERKWIKEMRDRGCRLINYTNGGERGYKCSDEYKAALSASQKGKKRKPLTEQHKARISAANKGKCYNPHSKEQFIRLNKSRAGKPLSEETKRKLSEINRENFFKRGWKEKISSVNRSRPYKSKMTESQKAEIKFLLNDGYSIKVISETYGISLGTVSYVRRNRIWKNVAPTKESFDLPPYKTIPILRNEKGQYERAA